jgi:hypothetical protein
MVNGMESGMLLTIIVVTAVITFVLARATAPALPRAPWHRFRKPYRSGYAERNEAGLDDVGRQLQAVMAASFKKRRVLSYAEYRTFKITEEEAEAVGKGHRVFAQTSLGEILQSPSSDAFRSINSKRADVLVVDGGGWPVLVVEYQGSGHYQGTAAARDAIKKEALRKAGVRYLEISEGDDENKVRDRVREQLGRNGATVPVNAQQSRQSPSYAS